MTVLISENSPTARKDHRCMACEFVFSECLQDHDFSYSELRSMVKAKKSGYKIKKGDTYVKQFCKEGGDIWTFKAIPAMHQICLDHDMYQDY